jgi:hypothetical protein
MFRITITEISEVEVVTQGEWVVLSSKKDKDGEVTDVRGYAPSRTAQKKVERTILNHEMEAIDLPGIVNAIYPKPTVKEGVR